MKPTAGEASALDESAPSRGSERDLTGGDGQGGVSPRALLTGYLLLAALAPIGFYIEVAWLKSGEFVTHAPAIAPVALLFLLAAAAGLPALRRVRFTRKELLVIYAVVVVAAPLYGLPVLFYMIPKVVIYYYVARANPAWESTFLQYIPTWWAPTDPAAVEAFFLGKARVPWSLWLLPLSAWGSFMLCLFTSSFCLLALVEHQWVANERLAFPQAQIPLEMVRQADSGSARLPRTRAFWAGLILAFLVTFVNSLSQKVPAVPTLPLNMELIAWQKIGPLAGLGALTLYLYPWVLGLVYLIQKEVAFSCWFFWAVRLGLTVLAIAAGATPQRPEGWYDSSFPAPYFQGTGAAIILGLWVFWIARRHLLSAVRFALGRQPGRPQMPGPKLYRWALVGLIVSVAWMLYFCHLSGCRLIFSLALLGLIVGQYVVWARLRAETGVADIELLGSENLMPVPFGTGAFRPREIITLITMRWASFSGSSWTYHVCSQNALETFKIADAAGISKSRLFLAVTVGFVISLLIGCFVVLTAIYHYGYFGTGGGAAGYIPSLQSRYDGSTISEMITSPTLPDRNAVIAMAVGAAVAILLSALRLRFWWWPFHPIGYIAASAWDMNWFFVAFVLGWAAKSLVIRYGGLRLYRATIPFAVGLIVGNMLNGGLWAAIALLTQGSV